MDVSLPGMEGEGGSAGAAPATAGAEASSGFIGGKLVDSDCFGYDKRFPIQTREHRVCPITYVVRCVALETFRAECKFDERSNHGGARCDVDFVRLQMLQHTAKRFSRQFVGGNRLPHCIVRF